MLEGLMGRSRTGGNSTFKRATCPVCGEFTLVVVMINGYASSMVCGSAKCNGGHKYEYIKDVVQSTTGKS